MGNCVRRQRSPVRNRQIATLPDNDEEPYLLVMNSRNENPGPSAGSSFPFPRRRTSSENSSQPRWMYFKLTENDIDKHVLETLRILRVSAENDTDLILRMRMFRFWANGEVGWKMVLHSLIRAIPLDDPLGPSAITLFIDHCPLPTKQAVANFVKDLHLSKEEAKVASSLTMESKRVMKHRNICTVLGHLTETLAPPFSVLLLTDNVLKYFLEMLNEQKCASDVGVTNTLFTLIALEKISQVRENKNKIIGTNVTEKLAALEGLRNYTDHKKRQVGFLAQWMLDNTFFNEGRAYTYETVDVGNINVMLNDNDVSEYLKISADGLEARSDASSFESVRCTFAVDEGVWFYEVTVVTSGVMQIGWATKKSKFLNHDGFGIGDDEFSCAYDGCRQLLWYHAQSRKHGHPTWKEGDTLGLLLDIDNFEVVFYLNGDPLPPDNNLFNWARCGFFAAASFMSFQQCRFNFGSEPFKFPPTDRSFKTFNEVAVLDGEAKKILPRHKKLQAIRKVSVKEDSCSICYDITANTALEPCGHDGICHECASIIKECHLCREFITNRKRTDKNINALNEIPPSEGGATKGEELITNFGSQ